MPAAEAPGPAGLTIVFLSVAVFDEAVNPATSRIENMITLVNTPATVRKR
jgi:hypothetical protein